MNSDFLPDGLRPAGVVPAAPRVIYKHKRDNLSHEKRIGRIDKIETLNAFRAFSQAFNATRPRPAPALAALLHNHGFMPDKGALYGLAPNSAPPDPDAIDTDPLDPWLSDFQTAILPMANGRYAPAIANRLLFWRLYGHTLPLAPLAASVERGRLIHYDTQREAGTNNPLNGPFLARPMLSTQTEAPQWEPALQSGGIDRILLYLPPQGAVSHVTRMLVLYDPKTRRPVIVHAVLLEGALETLDQPGTTLTSRRIMPEAEIAGPALRFTRERATPPEPGDPDTLALPNWRQSARDILYGLARLPVAAVLQIDLLSNDGATGAIIIDATDQIDATAHQIHGPLMGSDVAVRFVKEFGL